MSSNEIVASHDRFFKKFMSDLRVAKSFFKNHLSGKILNKVDLHSLAICKESFVDRKLELLVTDILYSVNFSNRTGYIYLLV